MLDNKKEAVTADDMNWIVDTSTISTQQISTHTANWQVTQKQATQKVTWK